MKKKYLVTEFIKNINLTPEMEALRSITFSIYNLTDFFLDALLIEDILAPIEDKLTEREKLRLSRDLNKIFLEINLIRKFKLTKRNIFILKIKKEINEINDIKNWFSHSRVYIKEIHNLQQDRRKVSAKTRSFRKLMVSLIEYWLDTEESKYNKADTQALEEMRDDINSMT